MCYFQVKFLTALFTSSFSAWIASYFSIMLNVNPEVPYSKVTLTVACMVSAVTLFWMLHKSQQSRIADKDKAIDELKERVKDLERKLIK